MQDVFKAKGSMLIALREHNTVRTKRKEQDLEISVFFLLYPLHQLKNGAAGRKI